MKIEIPDVGVIYPNEETSTNRTLIMQDDFELLQFTFAYRNEHSPGGMTLNKEQMILLRDSLNLMIKNKLVV